MITHLQEESLFLSKTVDNSRLPECFSKDLKGKTMEKTETKFCITSRDCWTSAEKSQGNRTSDQELWILPKRFKTCLKNFNLQKNHKNLKSNQSQRKISRCNLKKSNHKASFKLKIKSKNSRLKKKLLRKRLKNQNKKFSLYKASLKKRLNKNHKKWKSKSQFYNRKLQKKPNKRLRHLKTKWFPNNSQFKIQLQKSLKQLFPNSHKSLWSLKEEIKSSLLKSSIFRLWTKANIVKF